MTSSDTSVKNDRKRLLEQVLSQDVAKKSVDEGIQSDTLTARRGLVDRVWTGIATDADPAFELLEKSLLYYLMTPPAKGGSVRVKVTDFLQDYEQFKRLFNSRGFSRQASPALPTTPPVPSSPASSPRSEYSARSSPKMESPATTSSSATPPVAPRGRSRGFRDLQEPLPYSRSSSPAVYRFTSSSTSPSTSPSRAGARSVTPDPTLKWYYDTPRIDRPRRRFYIGSPRGLRAPPPDYPTPSNDLPQNNSASAASGAASSSRPFRPINLPSRS
jgi:hypothetical protein